MKYGFMPGTHEENRSNPTVRSKFDKSQGKGLPAPHLKHPGEVAKDTGSRYPGHNENGHKMPVERVNGFGDHQRRHYTPGEMGAPILKGQGTGVPKNTRITDSHLPHRTTHLGMDPFVGKEPDPVSRGTDRHASQHNTGKGQISAKSSKPQKMEDSSTRRSGGHAQLDRVHMKNRS